MAELRKLSEANIKDEEESAIKRNIDNSDKINFDREDEKIAIKNVAFDNTLKRYSLDELLALRNSQLSMHNPPCAIRRELQALSIWTCRQACEVQHLGLTKPSNAGNAYGNCNGSCQLYAREGQPYTFHNSQAYSGTSQMCYANAPNSLQVHPMLSNSQTMVAKKAQRDRERIINYYQRKINSELVRSTSPSVEREGTFHHVNQQAKPAFIDHRSISSSHLMPAFAKRRMGHANVLHGQLEAVSHYNTGGNNAEHLSSDGALNESSNNCDSSVRPRKESINSINDSTDYHLYKTPVKGRMVKSDRSSSDYSPSGNKVSPGGTVNKKLISERRIGSGRLIPREASVEMRTGSKKRIEKEIPNIVSSSAEKENDSLPRAIDKPTNRNPSVGRYSDTQMQEMRIFDRRISNSEDPNSSNSNSRNKKYTTGNLEDERNNFESNYQQAAHFAGKRSISFRRREYVDPKDHHRDYRDFRERKEPRDGRENREQREDDHHHHQHHHHFYHRDNKEEPEWFSEGPTSQHETIELRGFEETDDTQLQEDQETPPELYSKTEKMSSNSSLLSLHSSSNVNLSAKSNIDIPNEISNNSDNKNDTLNNDVDNHSNCNENTNEEETNSIDKKDDTDLKEDLQQTLPKTDEYENSEKQRSNVTELFIDNFLNMEAIENSLLSGGNDQSASSLNDGGGTSRFSRWFFNNSNNVNSNDEFNNNPPSKEDTKQHKDINESDFNSFMSFFKCNNYHTPELPKGLPSNVSALSVEELEARMRKMDTNEAEKTTNSDSGQNLHKNALSVEELEARMRKLEAYEMENFGDSHNTRRNDNNQTKKIECPTKPEATPQTETNTQDVEAFRKLLDQLGKPPVDIAMNINLQGPPGQPQPIKTHVGAFPSGMSQLSLSNPMQHINMSKQEFMMPNMHQQQPIIHHRQQNVGKMPIFPHQYPPHSGMAQLQSENIPFMPVSHHPHGHHMPMMIGQPQKRLDVQHLIQSVVRGELSRTFLEKELQNRNISPYNKEVITTVLKETVRFNIPDSMGAAPNSEQSVAPNNLMQSLARGEVSLNFVEHELNKLNNININDASASATFKERSRCGTPLTSSLNVASIPTSGSMIVPLASQVVPRQEQNTLLTNETVSTDQQQHHQNISAMYRSNYHDQHSQAMMQNVLFKKKLEMEQQEALRRRQENFKQQKQEPDFINQLHQHHQQQHQHQQQSLISNSTISQQGHLQSSRQINNPTPLAFMPTSVLRKMTAEKEPITSYSHATTTTSSSTQPHLQQPHMKIPTHPQMSYQHSNQPRIILGRGNFQYMHQQQQSQIPPAKKPTLSKAERRAIQEAQRAAKAQAQSHAIANKTLKSTNAKATPSSEAVNSSANRSEKIIEKTLTPATLVETASSKRNASKSPVKTVRFNDGNVKLFSHLEKPNTNTNLFVNNNQIHPTVARLGEQYAKRTIVGSNARCLAFLNVIKMVIQDYETPPKKEFNRSLESFIANCVDYLQKCRTLAVSVINAHKSLKQVLMQLPKDEPESELKERLFTFIDTYIENQIGKAAQAINSMMQQKINNGDVILTFGCSSLINYICEEAQARQVDFRVIVVDSRPFCEGKELLRRLTAKEIPCTYVLINAVSFVMPEVTKVLMGAHALLANGYVMARTGTAQVALVARSFNVPVLVCCETHKFSERFQTDAIVYNELGNPDDIVVDNKCCLSNWQSKHKMSPLNLNYDITPPELVTAVVTEVSVLPCTSVPVILRIKPDWLV